jgi:hypothetical protein
VFCGEEARQLVGEHQQLSGISTDDHAQYFDDLGTGVKVQLLQWVETEIHDDGIKQRLLKRLQGRDSINSVVLASSCEPPSRRWITVVSTVCKLLAKYTTVLTAFNLSGLPPSWKTLVAGALLLIVWE